MKLTTFITLIIMTFLIVSCGDKDKSKSNSGVFGSTLTTQEGFYNLQNQNIEVGQATYPPSQQYAQVMNQALQQAQMNRVQPVNVNGVQKYRARITASANTYQPVNGGYNPGQYQQGGFNGGVVPQGTLNISFIQFY
jgi:major membrane immunogen (membrane-anchored lipoprotein)